MRYSNGLLSGMLILCLAVFLLAGCLPKLEDEPSQRNDATPAQQDSQAKSKLQMLQAEYDKLSANYEDVKSELETTQAKYDELGTNYERNFLHEKAKYGAVGVAKSGEVFYITYFADIYGG